MILKKKSWLSWMYKMVKYLQLPLKKFFKFLYMKRYTHNHTVIIGQFNMRPIYIVLMTNDRYTYWYVYNYHSLEFNYRKFSKGWSYSKNNHNQSLWLKICSLIHMEKNNTMEKNSFLQEDHHQMVYSLHHHSQYFKLACKE